MSNISDLLITTPISGTKAAPIAGGVPPVPASGTLSPIDTAYDIWSKSKTPEAMQGLLDSLEPTIVSEIQRFSGPKPLLRSRARALAVKAVRSFDPMSGAKLRSWVVTQLQPLSRYNNSLKPVYVPEDASRKSYAVAQAISDFTDETGREPTEEELADKLGISVKRLQNVRKMTPALVNEPQVAEEVDTAPEYAIYHSNPMRSAADTVYSALSKRDKRIYDLRTGEHGAKEMSGKDIASLLRISPTLVTRRSNEIANNIVGVARRLEA